MWWRLIKRFCHDTAAALSSALRASCAPRRLSCETLEGGGTKGAHELIHAGDGRQRVQVLTGDVRNAGTPCGASVVLVGTDGQSKAIALGDSADTGACHRRISRERYITIILSMLTAHCTLTRPARGGR